MPPPLDAVEVAVGQPLGGPRTRPLPQAARGTTSSALERHLIDCLARPPCAVSFSGGRDSSALLVMAADVARRHELEPPVALTLVFPGVASADERAWQELVLSTVPEVEWQRVAITDELDIVGDVARGAVERHGLLFPWNSYAHLPLVAGLEGGTLVTGVGGDELMGSIAEHPVQVAAGRARPRRSDLGYAARWLRPGDHRWLGRATVEALPWVRPAALEAAWAREGGYQRWLGLRWDRGLRRWSSSRYVAWQRSSLAAVGEAAGTAIRAPFLEPDVIAAFAADHGWAGPRSREAALVSLFGDLLPRRTSARRTKATFSEAFFGERSREARRAWDGTGVDPEVVDPERLADAWAQPVPDARTGLLLQQVVFGPLSGPGGPLRPGPRGGTRGPAGG